MSKSEKIRNRQDFNRHLGQRLAHRRLEMDKSAAQLERALSLAPGSIAAFENGRRAIGAGLLFALSRHLGVPVAYFFKGAPIFPGTPLKGLPSEKKIAAVERFLDAYFKVEDRDVRRDILGLMKATGESKSVGRAR
ncbi:MAG: helix-turn-helix transcriptional regulator [Alphaproteobacteria bacterium]|nr:helix-turn-helix transcriptional regulator [Alphaproteobacteria bacterium]